MKPEVSIITPAKVRNKAEYAWLSECIESVKGQSYERWEMVIVDDASALALTPLQEKYAGDDRIRWFHTNGVGAASARNHAASQAMAPLLLPVDADDKLAPVTSLQSFMAAWRQGGNKMGIVYSDLTIFGQDFSRYYKAHEYDLGSLLKGTFMCVGCLHRKHVWQTNGGWRVDMEGGLEDWEYWIRLGAQGVCGYHVSEPLYLYRQNPNGRMQAMRDDHALYQKNALRIRQLHQDLYNGKWPKNACKGTMRPAKPQLTSRSQGADESGGLVKLQYTGPRQAGFRVKGYKVPGKGGYIMVRSKDVAFFQGFKGQYHRVVKAVHEAVEPKPPGIKQIDGVQTMQFGGLPKPLPPADESGYTEKSVPLPPMEEEGDEYDAKITAICRDNSPIAAVKKLAVAYDNNEIPTHAARYPGEYTVREIRVMVLRGDEAQVMLEKERVGKNRKTVIAFLERKANA